MTDPYSETLTRVAEGRSASVAQLHALATRLEQLPLEAAADALLLLEPALAELAWRAARVLERAPTGARSEPFVRSSLERVLTRSARDSLATAGPSGYRSLDTRGCTAGRAGDIRSDVTDTGVNPRARREEK
jgi:hypothetical protein